MTVVVAVASFLVGAAASAFLAAWFVRRSGSSTSPALAVGPSTATGLSQRVLGALDLGVVVVDRDEIAVFANAMARTLRVVDADRLAIPVLTELVRRVTDSGEPDSVTIDLAAAGRGPEYLTFAVRAMPLREHGRVASVVLRFFDVTDARRLELVRRDFVANVSHELKTPVGALTLLAEAVQEAADDPDAVQHFAERMQREGTRLGRLVQELIELSRLQGAEPLPGAKLVRVEHIVSEAVDRSRLLAEQTGISVVDRTEPGLCVRGNETQLTTAIGNLVDNAIAYSPARTRVSLTSRAETDADGAQWVLISVADQGIGIAETEQDRVFERFYRVDQARSRATGGTGLGLAIVKNIATNHGGNVAVWSVVGAGSTFTIRLPLASRSDGAGERTEGPPVVHNRAS
ncbi:MAG: ATP-binding protein [Actinomycetota bacterium]|nr:ATP-binding protein [Actinomycetota bacterium]MDQ2956065.1 ATP-binding protein [Actinomycetota bacterium]